MELLGGEYLGGSILSCPRERRYFKDMSGALPEIALRLPSFANNKPEGSYMAKIAFLGLGVMGFPMAGHLVTKGGHQVTVFNRRRPRRKHGPISLVDTPR